MIGQLYECTQTPCGLIVDRAGVLRPNVVLASDVEAMGPTLTRAQRIASSEKLVLELALQAVKELRINDPAGYRLAMHGPRSNGATLLLRAAQAYEEILDDIPF